jgi:starch synthase
VQTIHNLAYQGLCEPRWLHALDLPESVFTPAGLEFYGQISLLKGGIVFSDRVTTVSPTHAREVTTPEHGCGFEGILAACGPRFSGVLNGIDTEEWDPGRDRHLPATYSAEDLAGKAVCRKALLARFGLPTDPDALARPLVGMISRLVEQKGHGLIAPVADALVALGVTIVVMGEGEERFQRMWRELAGRWPGRVALHVGYDEPRAHLIQGGADLFLLPSLFEPCGLSQMYAQRYGTLPVVRATGGLADTVEPHDTRTGLGTGFVFRDPTPAALLETMRYAVGMRGDRGAWEALQRRAMARDFSWGRSAEEYERVYERALGG